jgi:hypothetical protein
MKRRLSRLGLYNYAAEIRHAHVCRSGQGRQCVGRVLDPLHRRSLAIHMIFSSDNVRPSTVVNSRDCGALVTIAASFSVTLCLIFYAARLLVRWPWRALFRYDDLVTSVATVCLCAIDHKFNEQEIYTESFIGTCRRSEYSYDQRRFYGLRRSTCGS